MAQIAGYRFAGVAREHDWKTNQFGGIYESSRYTLVDYVEKYDGNAWSIPATIPWVASAITAPANQTVDVDVATYNNANWDLSNELLTAVNHLTAFSAMAHETTVLLFSRLPYLDYYTSNYQFDPGTNTFTVLDTRIVSRASEQTDLGVGYVYSEGAMYAFDPVTATYTAVNGGTAGTFYAAGNHGYYRTKTDGYYSADIAGKRITAVTPYHYDYDTNTETALTALSGYVNGDYSPEDAVYSAMFNRLYLGPTNWSSYNVNRFSAQYAFLHFIDLNTGTTIWTDTVLVDWNTHHADYNNGSYTSHLFEGYNMFWWGARILFTFGVNSIGSGVHNYDYNLITQTKTTLPWRPLASYGSAHATVLFGGDIPLDAVEITEHQATEEMVYWSWRDTNTNETDTVMQVIDTTAQNAIGFGRVQPSAFPTESGNIETTEYQGDGETPFTIGPDQKLQLRLTPVSDFVVVGPSFDTQPVYSLAHTPVMSIGTVTFSTVEFQLDSDGNPNWTEYALWENDAQRWINLAGSLASTLEGEQEDHPYWQTRSEWNAVGQMAGLNGGGTFHVYARNGDGLRTTPFVIVGISTATVSGVVQSPEEVPLADVVVRAYLRENGKMLDESISDAEGKYSLTVWADRYCYVIALDPQYGPYAQDLWNLARHDYVIGIPS